MINEPSYVSCRALDARFDQCLQKWPARRYDSRLWASEEIMIGDNQRAMMAADIAYIKDNWAVLAAEAWNGWVEHGCGAMLIDLGSGLTPLAVYLTQLSGNRNAPGWPSAAIAAQIQQYNPQCEMIVLVLRNDQTLTAYRLASLELPPPVASKHLRQAVHVLTA